MTSVYPKSLPTSSRSRLEIVGCQYAGNTPEKLVGVDMGTDPMFHGHGRKGFCVTVGKQATKM